MSATAKKEKIPAAAKSAVDQVLTPHENGPLLTAVDDLLATMKKPEKGVLLPIPVFANGNHYQLLFRFPKGIGEIRASQKTAFEFIGRVRDTKWLNSAPASYGEVLGFRALDEDDLVTAFTLHYWSHSSMPISEVQGLHLVACNPTMARNLMQTLDEEHRQNMMFISFGGVIEKKDT